MAEGSGKRSTGRPAGPRRHRTARGETAARRPAGAPAHACEALESRLLLTGVPNLTDADLGSPALAGSASFDPGTGAWTVNGGGSDIWNASDQFNFASRPLAGDGTVIAEVNSQTDTSPYAKAGVMIRADNSPGAAFADVVVTPAASVAFQWRPSAGATPSAVYVDGIVTAPIRVELTRTGGTFAASYSYDGANWIEVGTPQKVAVGPAARAGLAVSALNNAALGTAVFTRVSVVARGWGDADIGSPGAPGGADFDGSNWTVTGGGWDIYGNSDQFNLASTSFVGDVAVVAHLAGIADAGGAYAKAGLMIRNVPAGTAADAADAAYAFLFATPASGVAGQGVNFEYRGAAGAATASAGIEPGLGAPCWLKLVRSGNTFTAYESADGADWAQDGSAVIIPMGRTVLVGLAVDGNGASALNTATFTHVGVVPAGWRDADIGSPAAAGSATYDGLTWGVSGGGTDVWGTSDQFNFASTPLVGDGALVARVDALSVTAPDAKAGLMIRDGNAADAAYAFLFLEPGALGFEYRPADGAASQGAGSLGGISGPVWLKLVRSGNLFTAWYSHDDASWSQVGPAATAAVGVSADAGLAVDAHDPAGLNSATFDNVSVGGSPADPFLATSGTSIRNGHGAGDVVPLRGTNLGGWLFHEEWFSGMDGAGLGPAIDVFNTLSSRFGTAGEERAYNAYQSDWITTADLDAMRATGINCIRVPFYWLNLVRPDGSWRADAFTHLDWIVNEAWKRGIYTVLDFHGLPGGDSTFDSSGDPRNQYFGNPADQQIARQIWQGVASHFAGDPGVAGYDLLNEPAGTDTATMQATFASLFSVVRAADPGHVIFVEGWGPADFSSLPPPSKYGWTNVVYELHIYAFDSTGYDPTTPNVEGATNGAVSAANSSTYGVPVYVGEFAGNADPSSYSYERWSYDQNGISWANWFWKNATGHQGDGWGDYVPGSGLWLPNLSSDSLSTILAAYASQTFDQFAPNQPTVQGLGLPTSLPDAYTTAPGSALYVAPAGGVLANDTDPYTGQSGLSAVRVSGVSHGSLSLWPDGSFYYLPDPGFAGTDTFRYKTSDGNADSTDVATVAIVVRPGAPPAGWSDADVGGPSLTGWAGYVPASGATGAFWTVASAGSDIWNNSDQFHLASRTLTGDGSVTARVSAPTDTDPWAKAGVMLRADASAGAAFAGLLLTPANGLLFEWRPAAGAPVSGVSLPGVTGSVWLRVSRAGGTFSAFYSTDNSTWSQVGTGQPVGMPGTALAGPAVTSHNAVAVATATFSGVTVAAAAPTVSTFLVDDGSAQRSRVTSLTLAFNTPVTLGPGAVALTQRAGPAGAAGGVVPLTLSNPAGDGKTWLVSFSGAAGPAPDYGSLPDGIYDLTIHAALVTNGDGLPMASDFAGTFHRLFGDFNGDGVVNAADNFQFKRALTTYSPTFDFNGDGFINAADNFQFKKRLTVSLT